MTSKDEPSGMIDIRFFKVIGLWQYIVPSPNTRYAVISSAILGTIFTMYITLQVANTMIAGYDFSIFTEKLSVNLTCLESAIKMLYYCSKRSSLYYLICCFNERLLLCSQHDETVTKRIMSRNAGFVNTATKSFMYMIFTTVGVWNVLPIFRCLTGDCGSLQIMPSWYPSEISYFPLNVFVYAFEFYVMVYCAALLYNVNCLFSALALSTSAQFELLIASFSSVEQNAVKHLKLKGAYDENIKQESMYKLLRECLIDHQTLLRLTKELEEMYNPMFLFQMLTSTFTICLVLVQLNVHLSSSDELPIAMACKFIMYLVFGSMELLVYSWGGQIIYDKTGDVHRSLYETGWDVASLHFRRSLMIAMSRSYRPESLTAGKFYRVDLSSFTQIIKASYSYFTFLHGSDSLGR